MKKSRLLLTITFFCIIVTNSFSQWKYQPAADNLKNREWFQQAKFGLFIHWGVYSVLGDGEWVMNTQQIPIKIYEKLPTFFNPTEFNAQAWVQMAKAEVHYHYH
jgi:alpha-L-fucosidase